MSLFTSQVRNYLREGYGVEDIAILLNRDVEDVRREVKAMRKDGTLALIYRRPAECERLRAVEGMLND